MARPRKTPTSEEKVAAALGVTLQSDVMGVHELAQFPSFQGESPRNQGIMCALACGYSQCFVAKMFGIRQPTVWEIAKRIDPDGMFKLSPNAKKAFITKIAESRGLEALSSITPEKLEDASAKELMGIGKDMVAITSALNQSKHKEIGASRLERLMDVIEEERVEVATYEEVADEQG